MASLCKLDNFLAWDRTLYHCPVNPETFVEIIDVSGTRKTGKASLFYWFYQGWSQDIAHYRVVRNTALQYILSLRPALPMSIETPCTVASNSEVRRWLQNKAVLINGEPFEPTEEMPPIIYSLVFFPKSLKRKTTLL